MDEPDAPLSFVSCLSLVALLHDLAGGRLAGWSWPPTPPSSPRCRGRRILELGDWGIRPAQWEELEIVQSWRMFLGNPDAVPALPARPDGDE